MGKFFEKIKRSFREKRVNRILAQSRLNPRGLYFKEYCRSIKDGIEPPVNSFYEDMLVDYMGYTKKSRYVTAAAIWAILETVYENQVARGDDSIGLD